MTDSATAARRVAALTLIPTSVAVFGAGLAWATSNDPQVASAPESEAAAPVPDPQLAVAQAKVDDARDKLAQLQAEVNARNAERVAIQEQQAAGVTVPAPAAAAAPAGAPAAPAAAPKAATTVKKTATVTQPVVVAPAAAAPKVQTVTKSSKK